MGLIGLWASSGMDNTLADLQMLAESARRTNDPARYKDEAKAVLSMGVIYDNRMVCVISLPRLKAAVPCHLLI